LAIASPFSGQAETHADTRAIPLRVQAIHITTGGIQIIKTADGGAVVILDSDFSLDAGPDPRVGFGKDGPYVEATDLGALKNLTGVQVFVVQPQ
jgi:hypothetical protein